MRKPGKQRGAATVETAISLILVLPIVMYAILLIDLLNHHLDLQESALTSVWDYAFLNYQGNYTNEQMDDVKNQVQRQNQLMWCDHTSAYDSYDKHYDCSEEVHHTELGARACWLNDATVAGADKSVAQVTCTANKDVASDVQRDLIGPTFHNAFTKGGMFTCRAQMYAMNYFVPQKLFVNSDGTQAFSQTVLTDRERFDGDNVHSAGSGAGTGDVFVYPRETYALLTDTWALAVVQDELPGERHTTANPRPLQRRTQHVFNTQPEYGPFAAAVGEFMTQAEVSQQLLLPGNMLSGGGSNPLWANVALRPTSNGGNGAINSVSQEGTPRNYNSTPWRDWSSDRYRRTWQARGKNYMGCRSPEQGDESSC
jgi:hypothetical protein